jgi:hypothetical protein
MEKLQQLKLILEAGENAHDVLCLYIVADMLPKVLLALLGFTVIILAYKLIKRALEKEHRLEKMASAVGMDSFDSASNYSQSELVKRVVELAEKENQKNV